MCTQVRHIQSWSRSAPPENHFLSPAKHSRRLPPWIEMKRNFLRIALSSCWKIPQSHSRVGLPQAAWNQAWALQDLLRPILSHQNHQNYNKKNADSAACHKEIQTCEADAGAKRKRFYSEAMWTISLHLKDHLFFLLKPTVFIVIGKEGKAFFLFNYLAGFGGTWSPIH